MTTIPIQVCTRSHADALFPGTLPGEITPGWLDSVAVLECGTLKGETAILMKVTLSDGNTSILHLTAEQFLDLAKKIRIAERRFGQYC